jgi:hypothetical protein
VSDARALVLELDRGAGRAELPAKGMLVVGSDADRAELVLEGEGVEDAHCAIGRVKDGGWAIKDLGSGRGTRVNGRRVESARLEAGDVIELGARRLGVVDPAAPPPEPAPAPAPGSVPERLGGYRVESALGRGGMGEVVLAVQESLNRHVALKVLSKDLAANREFVLRFHSEARAAAALSHPNVVVVHDVGEDQDRHFLSMEYMPGGSLEERVARDGRLPWRKVLDVLHDAAAGLTYAEEQGIVHRDIKPANLMVAASGAVKIADLGLATPVAEQGAGDQVEGRKTYGTPHFISPEQARGQAIDHRSDLYSLGATAYRLVTGRTPFEGATARDIVRARFQSDPPPPRSIVPSIPPDVEALILRLMAREPRERYGSATTLLREVDRIRHRADHSAPSVLPEPEPRRAPLLVGGALVVVVAIAAGAFLFGGDEGDPGPVRAEDSAGAAADRAIPEDDPGFFGDGAEEVATEADEERRLRALEREAQEVYDRIPAGYADGDRLDALEELVARFGPTSVARRARDEIDRLRGSLRAAETSAARRAEDVAEALERVRAAAGWPPAEGVLPDVGATLDGISGYRVSTAIETDPGFLARRRDLLDEVVATSAERASLRLAAADELAAAGNFAGVRATLEAVVAALALPSPRPAEPYGLQSLRELAARTAARLAGLEGEAQAHARAVAAADELAIGAALGPGSGLREELAAVLFDAALTRLTRLEGELSTDEARSTVRELAARVQRGRSALILLRTAFEAGAWRRRTVAVPGGRRPVARETVRTQAEGLVVAVDGGAELVPWGVFASSRGGLEQVFRGRLTRAYSAEEHADIASLLALTAATRSVLPADAMLAPGGRGLFRPTDEATMAAAFEPARTWLEQAGHDPELLPARAEVERERAAARLLGEAFAASQEEAWTLVVSKLEFLFESYDDTLVVTLLSDGGGPGMVASEQAPRPGAGPAGPETPESEAPGAAGEVEVGDAPAVDRDQPAGGL